MSKLFFIGEATIRRDLDKLEKKESDQTHLWRRRTARRIKHGNPYLGTGKEQAIAKDMIGRLAADAVQDGDIIVMDSSTTTYAMIPYLRGKKDLTIITNGVKPQPRWERRCIQSLLHRRKPA